jgi:hypothetical protein
MGRIVIGARRCCDAAEDRNCRDDAAPYAVHGLPCTDGYDFLVKRKSQWLAPSITVCVRVSFRSGLKQVTDRHLVRDVGHDLICLKAFSLSA